MDKIFLQLRNTLEEGFRRISTEEQVTWAQSFRAMADFAIGEMERFLKR